MKCKVCQQELEEGVLICPDCGSAVVEEEVQPDEVVTESTEAPVEVQEELPVEEAVPVKKKTKTWVKVLGITACVVTLAALLILLLGAFGVWDELLRPNDINKKDSYTAQADDKAVNAADKVVAEVVIGESSSKLVNRQLTNAMLQIYYKAMVADFVSTNSSYLSYMGLDYNSPLADQVCYYDESLSWEQYFINAAIESWHNYQIIYMTSIEAGYVPSATIVQSLEAMPQELETMAKEEGFDSADAFIRDRFGPATGVDEYLEYLQVYYVGAEFLNIAPTDAEIEEYYKANEEAFKKEGIDKASGNMVNVRHILLQPEGGTADDETESIIYTDAEWEACKQAAEALLQQWKDGDATEESFAALAQKHSTDGGSSSNGGLYTGITSETSFVEPFLEWCMDENRKLGDTDIVKTEYGYHIMYFAYTQEQWYYYARTYFLSDKATAMLEDGGAKWTLEVDYSKILLPTLDLK